MRSQQGSGAGAARSMAAVARDFAGVVTLMSAIYVSTIDIFRVGC
jgi:hypothetical protein